MSIRLISAGDKDMANGRRDTSGTPLSEQEIEYVKSEINRIEADVSVYMGTQVEKKIFPTISHQSIMLAKQARMEKQKNGYVTVVCPKCHEHPEIITTSKGERTTVSCPCGYVKNIEINF